MISVLSCSVFEADDEHEVVSSTPIANQAGVNGTREKFPLETFNCLRGNFTVRTSPPLDDPLFNESVFA